MTAAFGNDLYAARADTVLNGHEHDCERFAPQTPAAVADPTGIREFVVGKGGAFPNAFGRVTANSQKRFTGRYGVLRLTLRPTSYEWAFVAVDGSVLDRGGPVACHRRPGRHRHASPIGATVAKAGESSGEA